MPQSAPEVRALLSSSWVGAIRTSATLTRTAAQQTQKPKSGLTSFTIAPPGRSRRLMETVRHALRRQTSDAPAGNESQHPRRSHHRATRRCRCAPAEDKRRSVLVPQFAEPSLPIYRYPAHKVGSSTARRDSRRPSPWTGCLSRSRMRTSCSRQWRKRQARNQTRR